VIRIGGKNGKQIWGGPGMVEIGLYGEGWYVTSISMVHNPEYFQTYYRKVGVHGAQGEQRQWTILVPIGSASYRYNTCTMQARSTEEQVRTVLWTLQ
jgi:hypothetical protein